MIENKTIYVDSIRAIVTCFSQPTALTWSDWIRASILLEMSTNLDNSQELIEELYNMLFSNLTQFASLFIICATLYSRFDIEETLRYFDNAL